VKSDIREATTSGREDEGLFGGAFADKREVNVAACLIGRIKDRRQALGNPVSAGEGDEESVIRNAELHPRARIPMREEEIERAIWDQDGSRP
jgi:hypothetical protein